MEMGLLNSNNNNSNAVNGSINRDRDSYRERRNSNGPINNNNANSRYQQNYMNDNNAQYASLNSY